MAHNWIRTWPPGGRGPSPGAWRAGPYKEAEGGSRSARAATGRAGGTAARLASPLSPVAPASGRTMRALPAFLLALAVRGAAADAPTYRWRDADTGEWLECGQCPPGTFVQRPCRRDGPTTCGACPQRHYTQFWNYLERCRYCNVICGEHEEEARPCAATHNRACRCVPGFFAHAGFCLEHAPCPPGAGVVAPGGCGALGERSRAETPAPARTPQLPLTLSSPSVPQAPPARTRSASRVPRAPSQPTAPSQSRASLTATAQPWAWPSTFQAPPFATPFVPAARASHSARRSWGDQVRRVGPAGSACAWVHAWSHEAFSSTWEGLPEAWTSKCTALGASALAGDAISPTPRRTLGS